MNAKQEHDTPDPFRRQLETDTNRPVYMYQAAFLCGSCGRAAQEELQEAGEVPERMDPDTGRWREGATDTDSYPNECHRLGKADLPIHCDSCDVFLGNELTGHGTDYVRGAVLEGLIERDPEESVAVQVWAGFYDWLDLPPVWVADDAGTLEAFRAGYDTGAEHLAHADADTADVEDLLDAYRAIGRRGEAMGEGIRWGYESATEGVGV